MKGKEVKQLNTQYDNLPQILKIKPQFCCWKYEERSGRKTKVPYNPVTRKRAKTNQRGTFKDFSSAVETIDDIPDFYFQAIGSGTGAIAAHEANLRLIQNEKYGGKIMSLQLSQNIPFTPIYDAWKAQSNVIEKIDEKEAYDKINKINAKVLSNRKPPYSIAGGLYDCLKSSSGDVSAVSNEEGVEAQKLFEEMEGCDICPESGIALASLIQKVRNGNLPKNAKIMLNITGGGLHKLFKDYEPKYVKPDLVIKKEEFDIENIRKKIKKLY
jgi:cysteate synthase